MCALFMWDFRFPPVENFELHASHWWDFTPRWTIFTCFCRLPGSYAWCFHCSHWILIFSWVCLIWILRVDLRVALWVQCGQGYLKPWWIVLMCLLSDSVFLLSYLHISHLNFKFEWIDLMCEWIFPLLPRYGHNEHWTFLLLWAVFMWSFQHDLLTDFDL